MNNKKTAIAWLCLKYEGKGPPMHAAFLGLDDNKYRKVCIYLKKNSDKANELERHNIKTFYLSEKKFFRVFNFAVVFKLSRILKQEGIKILHCQRHQAAVYGAFAARIAKTPLVFVHVHGLNRSKSFRRRLINWLALGKTTKIIAVSQAVRTDILECNWSIRPEQVVCLNNSIDWPRFANASIGKERAKEMIGLKPDSFVFGTVGRLAPTKGFSVLIKAFSRVKKEMPNSELVIVGQGRLQDKLSAEAAETGFKESIHFFGYRADVEKILQAMDVFVMPSIAEGMPGALLEAMAAGIPCIATNVGGIPEVLEQGTLGKLVKPADEKELGEAMLDFAQAGATNKQVIDEARERIKSEYNHSVIIKKLEDIYETEYKMLTPCSRDLL